MSDKGMDKITACIGGLVVGVQEIDRKVDSMRHLVELVRKTGRSISSAEFDAMLIKYSEIGEEFRLQLVRLFERMTAEIQRLHGDAHTR